MTRSDCSSWRLNPSSGEDFPRRPQRPVSPKRAIRHFAITHRVNTPTVHPREPPENASPGAIETALSRHRTSALAVLCLNKHTSAIENSCWVVHKLWSAELLCGNHRKNRKESGRSLPNDFHSWPQRLKAPTRNIVQPTPSARVMYSL